MPACWIASTLTVLLVPLITVESLAQPAPAGLHLTTTAELAPSFERGDAKQNVGRSRTFTLTYSGRLRKVPSDAKAIDLWLPWHQTDVNQTTHRVDVDASGPVSIGREPRFGNQSLHVSARAADEVLKVRMAIEATRKENSGAKDLLRDEDRARYLSPEPLVPLSGPVKELALQATRGLPGDSEKARAIYDKVTGMMTYDKSGTGWGRGDAIFA